MKERFSNVLAWLGFIYPALFWLGFLISLMGFDTLAIDLWDMFFPHQDSLSIFVAFGLYPFCAVVNYLMVGRFRLLPWLKK